MSIYYSFSWFIEMVTAYYLALYYKGGSHGTMVLFNMANRIETLVSFVNHWTHKVKCPQYDFFRYISQTSYLRPWTHKSSTLSSRVSGIPDRTHGHFVLKLLTWEESVEMCMIYYEHSQCFKITFPSGDNTSGT